MKLDGAKTRRARERLGFGLDNAAAEAGISKNALLRAEREQEIRPGTARGLAAAYGLRVMDLLPDETPAATDAFSKEWTVTVSEEIFRRSIEVQPTYRLWEIIEDLVASEPLRLFKDEKYHGPAPDALYRRSVLFARALAIREELLRRGEKPAEYKVLALKRYVDALEIDEDSELIEGHPAPSAAAIPSARAG